jgi:hypothetical protein
MSTPIRRIRSGCSARAARGHTVAPLTDVMNSRRLTASPKVSKTGHYLIETSTLRIALALGSIGWPMSHLVKSGSDAFVL